MKVGVSAVCKIRLFAGAASIVGSSSILIDEDDVSGCSTIGDLINVLCRLHPELLALSSRSKWVVDCTFVDLHHDLTLPIELAMIPPVSGG